MEKKHKKKNRINKRLILLLDGLLIVGVIAAAVVLIVTRSGGGAQPATAQASASPEEAAAAEAQLAENPLAYFSWGSDTEAPLSIDFDLLRQSGVNAVGWLYCEGTPINYPVLQSTDNEYYMTHNAAGKNDKNGTLFLDCRNSVELLDEQIFLYGNPMADGSMFGGLLSYTNQSFLDEHPSIYFLTPARAYRIDVYAAHTASPDMSNYPTWFADAAARRAFMEAQQADSMIAGSPDLAAASLATLVTSSDFESGENSRFLVNGVLVPLS